MFHSQGEKKEIEKFRRLKASKPFLHTNFFPFFIFFITVIDFSLVLDYYYYDVNYQEVNVEAVEVTSLKDRVVISVDKTLVSKEYLLNLLDRLQLENLAQKADFDEKVLEISEEIKKNWWEENKHQFLNE